MLEFAVPFKYKVKLVDTCVTMIWMDLVLCWWFARCPMMNKKWVPIPKAETGKLRRYCVPERVRGKFDESDELVTKTSAPDVMFAAAGNNLT